MGEALRARRQEVVRPGLAGLVHPAVREPLRFVVAVHHLGHAAALRVRPERLQLDEVRVVDAPDQLPRLLVDGVHGHLAAGPARVLVRDPDPLRVAGGRDPEPALEQDLGDVHDPHAVELVVEAERAVALRARRDQGLHAEHLDDLRVVVPHLPEQVDLALPQLVVPAALHEAPVQDHRLDPDRAEELDRGVEDDPVVRLPVVRVGELHLLVVVIHAARVVRVLGPVLDLDLRHRRVVRLAVEEAEQDRVRDRPPGAVLGDHSSPPPSTAGCPITFARSSRM